MEVMAVEALLEAWLIQRNYITFTRFPLWRTNGYSDIDVLGVKHTEATIHLGECKVRGGAGQVFVATADPGYRHDFIKHWLGSWDSCTPNLHHLFDPSGKNDWIFDRIHLPKSDIKRIEVTFCGNVWVEPDEHDTVNQWFSEDLERLCVGLPPGIEYSAQIVPTSDVVLDLLAYVRDVRPVWGKRLGDPVLDTFRELWRFLDPTTTSWVGAGRSRKEEVAERTRERLMEIIKA